MTSADIFVVMQTGLHMDTDFGIIRGQPQPNRPIDLMACLASSPFVGQLMSVAQTVDVDFTNVAACRAAVLAALQAADAGWEVSASPVHPGHRWDNGGWTQGDDVFSFSVERPASTRFFTSRGFVNGQRLSVGFVAVVQSN